MGRIARPSLAAALIIVLGASLRAQTAPPSNAVILAKIAALEQQIVALRAQLQPEPPAIGRTMTLAEASAEAAKVKHDWPMSTTPYTNADLKAGPPVAAPPPAIVLPPTGEMARQGAYLQAAQRDEMYWKTRMQDVHAKLDADRTALLEATGREAALDRRLHRSVDDNAYIRDRVLRTQVDGQWQEAVAEVGRLKVQVTNDQRAITTAEEEARRANVPPGWLRP